MRNSTKAFGISCLSFATGLFLYWIMLLISNFSRATRFGVDMPNVSASTGIVGAVCVALFALGVISVRSKTVKTLVLVRTAEGKVSSILPAEYSVSHGKAKLSTLEPLCITEEPHLKKRGKTKYVLGIAVLATLVSGYALTSLIMGFTIQEVMTGASSPLMVVSSQSMQPALNYGDLIIMKGEQAGNIAIGDIIAFNVPSPYDKLAPSPTIHRVVEKRSENEEIYFKTRGDYNINADTWEVPAENVVGEYTQFKIPYMGFIFLFLKTPFGLASLVLTVTLAFVYDHYRKKGKHEV
jgi:signal peptidase I